MASHEYIVGPSEDAHFQSLNEALKAAVHNDVLWLQAGSHRSTLPLFKHVTLAPVTIGRDQEYEEEDTIPATLLDPIIEADVTLKGLHVQGRVNILKGHVIIEQCNIYGGSDGVRVGPGCKLTLKNSRISHCISGGCGVYFAKDSSGEVENTDFYECRVFGVHVDGAHVLLRNNRIRDAACGIYFRRQASGLIEFNSVEYIKKFGIYVTENSSPTVRSNRIQQCGIHCAYVSKESEGTWTENVFEGSVHVLPHCNANFIENQITGFADIDIA